MNSAVERKFFGGWNLSKLRASPWMWVVVVAYNFTENSFSPATSQIYFSITPDGTETAFARI